MMGNIAQLEFFHVGGSDTASLDALSKECNERVLEGLELVLGGSEVVTGIKTVVRFYDVEGTMTAIVLQAEDFKKRQQNLLENFLRAQGFRRWWINKKLQRLSTKSRELREKVRNLAPQKLGEAIQVSRYIAVERSNHTFRWMRADEAHELVEASRRSKDVQLFVMHPNELLAEKNSIIGSVM